jgi:hypothetical protein
MEVSKERKAVYIYSLADMPFEAISYAVKNIIQKEDRFPVVAKIREYARGYRPPCNRMPVIPESHQVAEFSQTSDVAESPDAFFERMRSIIGKVGVA